MLTLPSSYNSIIYSGTPFNQYAVVSATESFLEDSGLNFSGVNWQALQSNYEDNSTLTQKIVSGMQDKAIAGQLFKMNNLDCIIAYAQQAQSTYGSLLLIVNGSNSTTSTDPMQKVYISDRPSSMFILNPSLPDDSDWSAGLAGDTSTAWGMFGSYGSAPDPFGWICGGKNTTLPDPHSLDDTGGPCVGSKLDRVKANSSHWSPFGEEVSYCLSEPAVEQCRLYGNFLLVLVVAGTNSVQIFALATVIIRSNSSPLLTIGDAISSFLKVNDDTTRDMCLASSHHFRLLNYEKREWTALLTSWIRKKRRLCSTVRLGRWVSAIGL
jgi:hypothetical protein